VRFDLDGNIVRTTGLAAGWVDYKVCSSTHLVRLAFNAQVRWCRHQRQVLFGARHQPFLRCSCQPGQNLVPVKGRMGFVSSLSRDLKFAVRQMRQTPDRQRRRAALLALGIGANVAIFSLVNALLLKPLPV
jgi:hypothetical protein